MDIPIEEMSIEQKRKLLKELKDKRSLLHAKNRVRRRRVAQLKDDVAKLRERKLELLEELQFLESMYGKIPTQ